MKKKALVLFAALLLSILALTVLPGDSVEARYKKPGCGECADGTLNLSTASCPAPATNCIECTVCG